MRKTRWMAGVAALSMLAAGCNDFLTNFAASSTVRVLGRAAPALQRFSDIDLAEAAIPGSLATMEGLMLIDPENEALHTTVARTYASLGFGFLEDHWEQAQVDDDEARMNHYQARASSAFLRAREVGFEMMAIWSKGVKPEDKKTSGLEQWKAYLDTFKLASQAPLLFWTAYSWARFIGLNRDNPDALGDLAYVRALADKVKDLDETFNGYAPHALVGGMAGSLPIAVGGQPDVACNEMATAITNTRKINLMYYVISARIIAVVLQDKPLYKQLLQFAIDAGDIDPENRLQNQIAKRKAIRYMAQADDLIADDTPIDEPPAPPDPSDTTPPPDPNAPKPKTEKQMRDECHSLFDPLMAHADGSGGTAPQ